ESILPSLDARAVLYCTNGTRSVISANNLTKMGYTNVTYLEGGMGSWKNHGFEIVANFKRAL
ncbi:hypothetical protein HK405_012312, partial [Cladochytrium tenue]